MRDSMVQSLAVSAALVAIAAGCITSCAKSNEEYISAPHGPYGSDSDGGIAGADGSSDAHAEKDAPKAPGNAKQCGICYKDSDCLTGYGCVASPYGDKFCAAFCPPACAEMGMVCVPHAGYPPSLDAGADADAALLPMDASAGTGVCVPPNNQTCACTADREGVLRACTNNNSFGSCPGAQTCTASAWAPCDAPLPSKETCDGVDNNCNGLIDSQDTTVTATDLCAGDAGAPHASFTCASAKCTLGGCEPGWSKYPATLPDSAGCPCAVDKTDVAPATDNDCSKAQAQGSLSDVGAAPLSFKGTLSSDTDVDWFAFETTDSKQDVLKNTYRIHIEFSSNPGDEFQFDVLRGPAGTQCQGTAKSALTSYDWCADSPGGSKGAADADCSGSYRVKVSRKPGATGTCSQYAITVTSGASGACPAADACGAQ
jgi:hypothetical protein